MSGETGTQFLLQLPMAFTLLSTLRAKFGTLYLRKLEMNLFELILNAF